MKTLKLILLVFALGIMQSCYKPATIRVQNNITQVKIVDVKWGEVYLATELIILTDDTQVKNPNE